MFRGTPLLVQLFLIYDGLSQTDIVRHSVPLAALPRAVLVRAGRILAQQRRLYDGRSSGAASKRLPRGLIEAAQAIGMTPLKQSAGSSCPWRSEWFCAVLCETRSSVC